MRLKEAEAQGFKSIAERIFGPSVVVRLFGSRVDDNKRGGDIDLHLEVDPETADSRRKNAFHTALDVEMNEEQIDVIIYERGAPLRWIDRAALREGIIL
jgi:predicted nucleotidyltransferase